MEQQLGDSEAEVTRLLEEVDKVATAAEEEPLTAEELAEVEVTRLADPAALCSAVCVTKAH